MSKELDFIHLHVHGEDSNLRLLDSTNKNEKMIRYVNSLNQNGLALTDHECLSGHIQFLKIIQDLKEKKQISQDFKPILGNEIYLTDENDMYREMKEDGRTTFYHYLLLAKDKIGHRMLRELSTRAWKRSFNYKNMERVPTYYKDIEEVIGDNKGHLIASTACLGGYLAQNVSKILNSESKTEINKYKCKIHDFITWNLDVFGNDFYIELQPSLMEDQIEFNKYVLDIAKAYKVKCIVTTDAHYLTPEDRPIHEAYLTSDSEGENNREVGAFYSSTYFFTIDMLQKNLKYLDKDTIKQLINHTKEIADKIEQYSLEKNQEIPRTRLPEEKDWFRNNYFQNLGDEYEYIKIMAHSEEPYDRFMISQVYKGMMDKAQLGRLKKEDMEETFERLNIECKELIGISKAKGNPISSYFTTMQKNVDIIWEEAESIIAPSRGSALGYIINYFLGITQINPLKQGLYLPHWRFISAERPDYPDIDIDISSHKRDIAFEKIREYYQSIGGDVVRVGTFGTETSKSAIQTACRGLHINSDIGLYLSSLIPVDRGKVWSLSDCYYGDKEKSKQPITEFKNAVDEHKDKNLLKVALGIEGLKNKRSTHACGVIIFNTNPSEYCPLMKAPSGELITQYELHDAESVGCTKYDFLNTKTCAMIQKTLEMLIEHEKIEWQGSLRKTYDKYLHPDIIDKENPELWKKLNQGEVISAFQFDSLAGENTLKKINPMNILEASAGNTLMRLMGQDGKEQPIDMYVRYKKNINEWFKDMKQFGLSNKEQELMKKYLLKDYGVCATQESMMMMSMDKNVSGFNVKESNVLRKSVAKKKPELLEESKNRLFEKGKQLGASKKVLDYVWEQFSMQKGYSFSILHTIGYTYVLIQQLNLVHYYPPIYWNTAVLLVESGALGQEGMEKFETNRKEKTTNYGTVAKAIGNMQDKGVNITLPNINKAKTGFEPYEETDEIMFGLKGVMNINAETSKIIMENRPFKNLKDFYERMVLVKKEVTLSTGKKQQKSLVSDSQVIMLIKSGAFDKIENKPREEILENYLKYTNPNKKKISGKTINHVIEMGIIPSNLKEEVKMFKFKEYIKTLTNKKDEKVKSIKWFRLKGKNDSITDYTVNFFLNNLAIDIDMQEDKDYYYDEKGDLWVALGTTRKGSFENVYKKQIIKLTEWLNSKECLDTYNNNLFWEIKDKEMKGNISTWEMESMNYYYHEHELACVNKKKYKIENYYDLPEEPIITGFTMYKKMRYPKFELTRIVGTVLDRNKNKHIVSLLTPNGVVNVKFYSGQFTFYDKNISKVDENGKKTVLENGWFKRGEKLLVTGFRKEQVFKPKRYKNSIFPHTVQKILEVKENGDIILQSERYREKE
ncbi:TPA: PHP domain-containing protein [Clostridium botulinum]